MFPYRLIIFLIKIKKQLLLTNFTLVMWMTTEQYQYLVQYLQIVYSLVPVNSLLLVHSTWCAWDMVITGYEMMLPQERCPIIRENNVDLIPMQLNVLKSVTRMTKRSCKIQTNQTGRKITWLGSSGWAKSCKTKGKKVNSA